MVKKILIILSFMAAAVGAVREPPLQGLVFADVPLSQQADPCPPECVIDSMEIVTWYPSPYNEYEELRLYPTQRDDNYCDNDKIGLMYYDHGGTPSFADDDKMKVCKGTLLGWQEVGGESFWKFADSSTSDIYYTKSGNVGIGTDTPEAKLHVVDASTVDLKLESTTNNGTTGAFMYFRRAGVTKKQFGLEGNDALSLVQGTGSDDSAVNRMYVRFLTDGNIQFGNGNVGLGVSPGAKLDFGGGFRMGNGNIYVYPTPGVNSQETLSLSNNLDATLHVVHSESYTRFGTDGGQGILFRTGGNTDAEERVRITSMGNVGIGTTAPMAQLNVISNIRNSSTPGNESNSFVQDVVILTSVTSWQTLRTITYAPISSLWTRGIIEAEVVGHTGGPPATPGNGNGLIISKWYFDIFDGALTVGIIGTDTTSGPGSPQFRLSSTGSTIRIQVQSGNGASTFTGTTYLRIIIPRTAGKVASFTIN